MLFWLVLIKLLFLSFCKVLELFLLKILLLFWLLLINLGFNEFIIVLFLFKVCRFVEYGISKFIGIVNWLWLLFNR